MIDAAWPKLLNSTRLGSEIIAVELRMVIGGLWKIARDAAFGLRGLMGRGIMSIVIFVIGVRGERGRGLSGRWGVGDENCGYGSRNSESVIVYGSSLGVNNE